MNPSWTRFLCWKMINQCISTALMPLPQKGPTDEFPGSSAWQCGICHVISTCEHRLSKNSRNGAGSMTRDSTNIDNAHAKKCEYCRML